MFTDSTGLLADKQNQPINAHPMRAIQMIKRNPKIYLHLILHYSIELLILIIQLIITSSSMAVVEHSFGRDLVSIEIAFAVTSIVLYLIHMVLLFFALRTHPIFTLITDRPRPLLFMKLANLSHTLYLIILFCCFGTAVVLSMTFNPTNTLDHPVSGLYFMIIVDLFYLQLAAGEMQKPMKFVTRKLDRVEMTERPEEQMEDEAYKNQVGVLTYGYNILGIQFYIKYKFDPNLGYIQVDFYFIAWVKQYD